MEPVYVVTPIPIKFNREKFNTAVNTLQQLGILLWFDENGFLHAKANKDSFTWAEVHQVPLILQEFLQYGVIDIFFKNFGTGYRVFNDKILDWWEEWVIPRSSNLVIMDCNIKEYDKERLEMVNSTQKLPPLNIKDGELEIGYDTPPDLVEELYQQLTHIIIKGYIIFEYKDYGEDYKIIIDNGTAFIYRKDWSEIGRYDRNPYILNDIKY